MKISTEKKFTPVTITLESEYEVAVLALVSGNMVGKPEGPRKIFDELYTQLKKSNFLSLLPLISGHMVFENEAERKIKEYLDAQ